MNRKTLKSILVIIVFNFLMTQANASSITLIKFGTSASENIYELDGWNEVLKDIYTDYSDIASGGTTISIGDNGSYNFQGIKGTERLASVGDIIRVTWYNNSNQTMTFTPKISFNDPDRAISGQIGQWYDMEAVTILPQASATNKYVMTDENNGFFHLINVNNNIANNQVLICESIHLELIQRSKDLVVDKSGDGSGFIQSNVGNINCGSQCNHNYLYGTIVKLEAFPDPGSKFDGWTDNICAGSESCTIVITDNTTIEASFSDGLPVADFRANVFSGSVPLQVSFNDISINNPTHWEWDFNNDQMIDSYEENPSYTYEIPGVFTVNLKVKNSNGENCISKKSYIVVKTENVGTLYEVGIDKAYQSMHQIALHQLEKGDVVRIYAKPAQEPYHEKLFIRGVGTENSPIRIVGVPDENGNKPIFDGTNAKDNTNYGNYYWNEDRQVILLGQYNNGDVIDHMIIEGLEIRGAVSNTPYTNDSGNEWKYLRNAAGIRVSNGNKVIIRDCDIYGNENGIFSSHTYNLIIENCHIHDNGMTESSCHEHNLYLGGGSGSKVTVQYCHLGELLNDGQQGKFRTETIIFRYNWVEGGKNSVLDLVEDSSSGASNAYVYGNILIKPPYANNSRMIHFGGDNPDVSREGVLYFYNNTCIIKTVNKDVRIFKISEMGASVVAQNNIFYKGKSSNNLLYAYESSFANNISGKNNWFVNDTQRTEVFSNSIFGDNPGFVNVDTDNYHLTSDSIVIDTIQNFQAPQGYIANKQYVKHMKSEIRIDDGKLDPGAYENQDITSPDFPIVLVDYAKTISETETSYGDWITLLYHQVYTEFVNPDDIEEHSGIAIISDIPEDENAFFGIMSKTPFNFEPGQRIVATFFNRSTSNQYLKVRLSFTDIDAPNNNEMNNIWYSMYNETGDFVHVKEQSRVELELYITNQDMVHAMNSEPSEGNHSLININISNNSAHFVLTKIEIRNDGDIYPPTPPKNAIAELTHMTDGCGDNLIKLSWKPAIDNETGISRYLIYRNNALYDTLSDQMTNELGENPYYIDLNVAPETQYIYTITAVDKAPFGMYPAHDHMNSRKGNESRPSQHIMIITPKWQTESLINPYTDFEYIGMIRLPDQEGENNDWSYAGSGLAYNPNGNPEYNPETELPGSLIAFGHDHRHHVAEISIPKPVNSSDINDVSRSKLLKPFVDLWPNIYDGNATPSGGGSRVAGLAYHSGTHNNEERLFYTISNSYTTDSDAPVLGSFSLDLTTATGAWHVGGAPPDNVFPGLVSRIVFQIPQNWADQYTGGKNLVVGSTSISGSGTPSRGTTLYAVAPWENEENPEPDSYVSATKLIKYGGGYNFDKQMLNYSGGEIAEGGAWISIAEKSSIAIVMTRSIGDYWYGDTKGQQRCRYDIPQPSWGGKGYGYSSSSPRIMLYHPKDLADVAMGNKDSWEPQPYMAYDLGQFSKKDGGQGRSGVITYDQHNGYLFFMEFNGDPAYRYGYSIIHVWKIKKTETNHYGQISGHLFTTIAGHENLSVKNAVINLRSDQGGVYTGDTNEFGYFYFQNLEASDYEMTINSPDLEVITRSITVEQGKELIVEYPLKAGKYTEQYLNNAIHHAVKYWDVKEDGKIGIEEAIRALKVSAGIVNDLK